METILVTGGAGFLGSCFVRGWLAKKAGHVVVLDRLTYAGSMASLASVADDERLVFRRGDIGDAAFVAAILNEFAPQAIVNFAAETHVDRSIDAPAPFVAANIVGTAGLLDASLIYWRQRTAAAREAFRFVHISTDEVYGPIGRCERAGEASPYRPSSPYAASKAAADHLVRAYHRTYGLPVLIVHPTNCFGPFQFPEKFLPLAILNVLDGQPIPIYGDGLQQRDWLFADDACRAVRVVLERGTPGESYNVATEVERTNLQLVRAICETVDRRTPAAFGDSTQRLMTHVADRPGHDRRYALDSSKIRGLGWAPAATFDRALDQTVAWYATNRAWVQEIAAHFDRTLRRGLPRS